MRQFPDARCRVLALAAVLLLPSLGGSELEHSAKVHKTAVWRPPTPQTDPQTAPPMHRSRVTLVGCFISVSTHKV